MTMLCKMLTGRSVRLTTLAFVTPHRALAILMALAISLNVAIAAPRPSTPPVETHVLTLPTCAGDGATVDITMDSDYMGDFGCAFDATLGNGGCAATVYIPSNTCVPSAGTVTMATVIVRNKFGNVHAVIAVRAVDGIVMSDVVDL